eukprot:3973771-Prymnesium_polylepis.1
MGRAKARKRESCPAATAVEVVPDDDGAQQHDWPIKVQHVGQGGEALRLRGLGNPIAPRRAWKDLPGWLVQPASRGSMRLCCMGHRLVRTRFHGAEHCECYECDESPAEEASVLFCRRCYEEDDCCFVICNECNGRPRLPSLQRDTLFHGPRTPALLLPPSFQSRAGTGTVIVVPGGNYEYLSTHEAWPVVAWLEECGIAAAVLRYRLLPAHGLEEALDDLEAAAGAARHHRPGPVAAIGFSAGGHLVAALGARAAARGHCQPLDAAVVAYPSIDAKVWADADSAGFTPVRAANGLEDGALPKRAASLQAWQDNLLGRAAFGAPPTMLVASTGDEVCPVEEHTDPYAGLLEREGVPHVYIRRNMGDHGFVLSGGWTQRCVKWLRLNGFGTAKRRRLKEAAH